MVLTTDSDKLGLGIGLELKNRLTGNFQKNIEKSVFSSDMISVVKIVFKSPELMVSEILGEIKAVYQDMGTPLNFNFKKIWKNWNKLYFLNIFLGNKKLNPNSVDW